MTQIFAESCVDFEVAHLFVLMVQRLPYPKIPTLNMIRFCDDQLSRLYNALSTALLQEFKGSGNMRSIWLNPVEFKQALSTHKLYQLEFNAYLQSTFTKLSIENLVPERIRRALQKSNSSMPR